MGVLAASGSLGCAIAKSANAPLRMTDWGGMGRKQVPRCARNDRKKGKGNGRSRSLWDDNQKGKGNGRSRAVAGLLEAGAVGDVFGEGGEDGFAAFFAGGEEHAVGFEAAHLAGSEVGDDGDAAADELFGGVVLGDAGEDLAGLVAEVDFEAEELVGFGDALGDDDLGDAEVDFEEVVDGDGGGLRGLKA